MFPHQQFGACQHLLAPLKQQTQHSSVCICIREHVYTNTHMHLYKYTCICINVARVQVRLSHSGDQLPAHLGVSGTMMDRSWYRTSAGSRRQPRFRPPGLSGSDEQGLPANGSSMASCSSVRHLVPGSVNHLEAGLIVQLLRTIHLRENRAERRLKVTNLIRHKACVL